MNALKTGKTSGRLQQFLKERGLPTHEEIRKSVMPPSEAVLKKIELLERYNQELQVILEYYKSTGERGLTAFDSLVKLNTQILELEEKLQESGENPLESKEYQEALKQKLELMKFLERIKFDKQKAAAEWSLKKEHVEKEDEVEL